MQDFTLVLSKLESLERKMDDAKRDIKELLSDHEVRIRGVESGVREVKSEQGTIKELKKQEDAQFTKKIGIWTVIIMAIGVAAEGITHGILKIFGVK